MAIPSLPSPLHCNPPPIPLLRSTAVRGPTLALQPCRSLSPVPLPPPPHSPARPHDSHPHVTPMNTVLPGWMHAGWYHALAGRVLPWRHRHCEGVDGSAWHPARRSSIGVCLLSRTHTRPLRPQSRPCPMSSPRGCAGRAVTLAPTRRVRGVGAALTPCTFSLCGSVCRTVQLLCCWPSGGATTRS